MTNSVTHTASYPHDFVPGALSRLHLLGFAHADSLAAMRCVSPLCPPVSRSLRVCASLSLPSARPLRSSSVRVSGCLPDGFPPAPRPRLVSLPPPLPHGPPHAVGGRAVPLFMRRFALTRRGCRKSERTPNHALQRTPGCPVQLPRAAVVRPAQSRAVLPAMKPGTARAFALRRCAHTRAHGPESLSLGSLGVLRPLFRE